MLSEVEISLFDRPSAIIAPTSSSRSESGSAAIEPPPFALAASRAAVPGSSHALPAATARTAWNSSAGAALRRSVPIAPSRTASSRQSVPPTQPGAPGCVGGTDCLELAVRDGAMGTLRRSAAPAELFQAVRAVAAGSAWLEPGTAARLAASANGGGSMAALPLSERELDVGAMIAEGRSNKEISTSLNISEPTVKKYVGRLLEKLRVEDRLQAGLYLARHPLVLRRRRSAAAR